MKNFTSLDWPTYDAYTALMELLTSEKVQWVKNQICLTTTIDHPNDFGYGVGSLYYDWDNKHQKTHPDGSVEDIVPLRKPMLHEEDFTMLCSQFHGTLFEHLYDHMMSHYKMGRIRFMRMDPRSVLSWHTDSTPRLHYIIQTNPGCRMVVDDEVVHMPTDTWWHADTTKPHTAFNGGTNSRIHLVGTILDAS